MTLDWGPRAHNHSSALHYSTVGLYAKTADIYAPNSTHPRLYILENFNSVSDHFQYSGRKLSYYNNRLCVCVCDIQCNS
jgi:hypothetical protein